MKKFLGAFLLIVVILGACFLIPLKSNAATVNDLTFKLNDAGQSYYVADCSESASGEIVIPSKYNGLPVTSIGYSSFEDCTSLTSITIPESVTSIGHYAFKGCTSLTSTTIPESVTSIGHYAFKGCTSLTSITIPDSVTSLDNYAFGNCSSLTSVIIPNSVTSIGKCAFDGCTSLTSVYIADIASWCNIDFDDSYANPLKYAKKLYLNGELVTDVVIPEGVTEIKNHAFYNCDALTSITIPEGVTRIGDYAFDNCNILASVTIPDSVTYIGYSAFENCTSLTSVAIPDSVTDIGSRTFCYCSSLTDVIIPNSVTSIGDYAFYDCSSLTSVTIPDSVTSVGNYAFMNFTSLTSINVSEGNKKYSSLDGVLFNKSKTEIIQYPAGKKNSDYTIPESVTNIGKSAFWGCDSIVRVIISNNVTSIDDYAFCSCDALTSIIIPNSVTSIGSEAFAYCSSLTSIIIPDSILSIGYSAFFGCGDLKVYITDITSWCNISFGDCYANPLNFAKKLYLNGSLVEKLVIPEGVTKIKAYTFYGLESLVSVTIPESVTSIYSWAFEGCISLTNITLPDSVTSLGMGVFFNCDSLISVTIGGNITSIGSDAFGDCDNLQNVYITDISSWCNISWGDPSANPLNLAKNLYLNGELITDLVIPEDVTEIKNYAFYAWESLFSVTIPDTIISIGNCVFEGCSSLTNVIIGNSVTNVGRNVFADCTSLTTIVIGSNVKSVGEAAFTKCENLQAVYITDLASWCNIDFGDSYDANPLYYAKNLYLNNVLVKNMVIPKGVTKIKSYTFLNCKFLTSVTIPNSVSSIGNSAFKGCDNLRAVYITDIFSWCNINFDNSYANPLNCANVLFLNSVAITDLIIPKGLTEIKDYAFNGCTSLASITIPDSVTSIGCSAFEGCTSLSSVNVNDIASWCIIDFDDGYANPLCYANNLYLNGELVTELVIPSSVTSIGAYAFGGCTSLASITIPDSVTSIGNSAFSRCFSLASITIPDSVISISEYAFFNTGYFNEKSNWEDGVLYLGKFLIKAEVDIPVECCIKYGTKCIANGAFFDCESLTSITIPNSVTNICYKAFSDCNSLKYVFYTGSSTDWKSIKIDSNNSPLTSAKIHYNATDHSHYIVKIFPFFEGMEGSIEDICPVCDFVHRSDKLVYINDHITAVDTKNAVVDTTRNTLVLDMSACKDINEAIVEMDGYTLTTTPTSSYGFIGTGSKVQVADSTGTQVAEYTLVVRGDVNGDSVCDSLDLMLIELARHENNNVTLEGAYFAAANLAEDSDINIDDFNAVVNRAVA